MSTDTTPSNGDQTITCRDCKNQFLFTVGEQTFYAEKAFQTPVRCKPCRDFRKASREGGNGHQAQPVQGTTAPQQPETYTRRDEGGRGRNSGGKRRRDEWDD